MSEAARAEPAKTHRCYCVIRYWSAMYGREREDHCRVDEVGPDQPFCTGCETRHPELLHDDHLTVAITVYKEE